MAAITPTTPTFTQVEAPVVILANNLGTLRTLDLTVKRGAWLYTRIGRRVVTALTRSAYVLVRGTDNDTLVLPAMNYDIISQTAAAITSTLSAAANSGTGTITVTSATGFAVGDTLCIHSDDNNAARVEFVRVVSIAGTTFTLERNLRVTHNQNDRVTTLADVTRTWVPGGDHYEIRCINNSGQDIVFAIDAIIDEGDTVA